jgi:hypothetical protein
MYKSKKKVLALVEGAKTDVLIMEKLFNIYKIDVEYEIVSYCTNIHVLYIEMFRDGIEGFDEFDLLQVLKSREPDQERKKIFDDKYTDIILVFDLDPQDPRFNEQHVIQMQQKFAESSDMGKLYLNYPMIEAFYHMISLPDENYNSRKVDLNELINKTYKSRVHQESFTSFGTFATAKRECDIVILQNLSKAYSILGQEKSWDQINIENFKDLSLFEVLHAQLDILRDESLLYILCSCVFFILDYDKKLILT